MYLAIQNAQINDDDVRIAWHDGLPHIVAPVVAVQEQVLKGELLPQAEIAASAASFSGRPLPVGHPTGEDDEFVSANDPEIWDNEVVGKLFDTNESDGQLLGEVYVNIPKSIHLGVEKAARYAGPLALLGRHLDGGIAAMGFDADDSDPINDDDGGAQQVRLPDKIIEALEKLADDLGGSDPDSDDAETANAAGALEVSTAYWYQPDGVSGTHDGEEYSASQLNVKPDHLALLPAAIGECSVKDGCGAPRANESGGAKVLADGGQPVGANESGEGETQFAFASDSTTDGDTVGDDPNEDADDDPESDDDGGSDSDSDSDDSPSSNTSGDSWFGGWRNRIPFMGSSESDDLGELENGAESCGCDHGNESEPMKNKELAEAMNVSVEYIENLSDEARKTLEATANEQEESDSDPNDDPDGGDGTDDGTGDDGPDSDPDDSDDAANDGGVHFKSREAFRDEVNSIIQNHEDRDAKRDIARDVAAMDPELDANSSDDIAELMEDTRNGLVRQRDMLAAMTGATNGASGWGDLGRGGDDGQQDSSGSNAFAGQILGSQSSDDGDGWGEGDSISAQHSGEAAVAADGGESEE